MEQETGVFYVYDSEWQEQLGGLVQEGVMGFGEFPRICEIFGGENVGVGGGEQCGGFIVSLVGTFSRGSGFSSRDSEGGVAGFRESRRR